jgi:hypothetical protein
METADILNKIESARNEYYSENQKNTFFKKQQKFDCAETIVNNIDLNMILPVMFKVETNNIIFNYSVFKAIASPNIYMTLAQYLFQITDSIIQSYGTYSLRVDLAGLTMSAIERYKSFLVLVSGEGQRNGKGFLKHLELIHVHNPPTFVEYLCGIVIPIVDPAIKDRFVIYMKNGNVVKYVSK